VLDQVHEGECDVVGHVDEAQLGVELDAVERHRNLVDQHDVGQMQVAMALADEPAVAPGREPAPAAVELLLRPLRQPVQPCALVLVVEPQQAQREVLARPAQHLLRRTVVGAGGRKGRPAVKPGDRGSQPVDVHRVQPAGARAAVGQVAGGKAAHSDRVLDGRPAAAEPRRRLGSGDPHHVHVKLLRGAPVQPDLLLAEVLPGLQRAEVDEAEGDRLLQLVGKLAGEQDAGDMGLDQRDRAAGRRAQMPAQGRHQRRVSRQRATCRNASALLRGHGHSVVPDARARIERRQATA
jgi:hypothetical protein